jgi:hypothetical protein
MKTILEIWGDIKPGDLILKQTSEGLADFNNPELVIVVGVDVWDMSMVVYYTNYKSFEFSTHSKNNNGNPPEVKAFSEWGQCWNILGHWKIMPNFKELLNARRKTICKV